MKKLIGVLLGLTLLLAVSSPVRATDGCRKVKVEGPGYAYVKVVCVNPTSPVRVRAVAHSTDGNATATAISVVIVNSSSSVVNNSVVAIANSSN